MHKKVLKVYPNIFWCLQQERYFLRVLEEASANISRSRSTVTTPLYTNRKSEIQRHRVPRKHSNEQQE